MRTIGVIAGGHVAVGVVENNRVDGAIRSYQSQSLAETPAEGYFELLKGEIEHAAAGVPVGAIGVGVPGIIRDGLIEESPNLQQLKGLNLGARLSAAFPQSFILIL